MSDLIVTKSGNFTDYVPLQWDLYCRELIQQLRRCVIVLNHPVHPIMDHVTDYGFRLIQGLGSHPEITRQIEQMDVIDVKKFHRVVIG